MYVEPPQFRAAGWVRVESACVPLQALGFGFRGAGRLGFRFSELGRPQAGRRGMAIPALEYSPTLNPKPYAYPKP